MATPREKLEAEVQIVAREPKRVSFAGKPVEIVGIPWEVMEQIGESIIKIFSPLFVLAARSVGAGGESSGADRLAEMPPAEAFDPEMFIQMGSGAREAVTAVVEHGTNADWSDIKKYDFALVVQLAVEVLKYNIGPSLRKNFDSGAREVLAALGVKITPRQPDQSTSSNEPSSPPDTA